MGLPRRIVTSIVGCALATLLAVPAHAQGGDRAVAEALFQKGRDAMDRADFQTACEAFEESNRLDPAPGTMANLGDCEEHRGRLSSAWQWFQQAASRLPADDERRGIVEQRATDLEARLPHLTIRLAPGAPPDSVVVRDTIELHSVSFGLSLPIDPGAHQIVVTAKGRAERRYALAIAERESKEITVEPGPTAQAPGAAPVAPPAPLQDQSRPTESSHSSQRTLGYVALGVGGVGIGTALVLGGIALGKKGTVQDHCNTSTHTCDSQSGVDAAASGHTLTTASTVAFVIGAVAAGAGAYLVLTSDSHPTSTVGLSLLPAGGAATYARAF